MSFLIRELMSRNLRKPTSGPVGWFVTKYVFEKKNVILEEYAAKLCNIEQGHNVLEVGFGPGVGLEVAYSYISEGDGKIYGAEISQPMIKTASKRLKKQINAGKIEILNASVDNLPFNNNSIDRVFHCNCYYFWPDLEAGCRELYRVMKPRSVMVTVQNMKSIKIVNEKGFMKYGNTDPERFMKSLKKAGFQDVHMRDITEDERLKFEAIFATVGDEKRIV